MLGQWDAEARTSQSLRAVKGDSCALYAYRRVESERTTNSRAHSTVSLHGTVVVYSVAPNITWGTPRVRRVCFAAEMTGRARLRAVELAQSPTSELSQRCRHRTITSAAASSLDEDE